MNEQEMRAAVEYLDACLTDMHERANGAALEETAQRSFDEGLAERNRLQGEVDKIEARKTAVAGLGNRPGATEQGEDRGAPQVVRKADPYAVAEDRSATPTQLADAVTRSLEHRVEDADNMAHVRSVLRRHLSEDLEAGEETRAWARNLIARTRSEYTRAFGKMLTGREATLTAEERAALSVGSNTNGGYLVPTHLDPTIILTNSGTSNVIRGISRVATLTEGNVWHGVSSAGVSASFDAELAEVSDDSPTFSNPAVTLYTARAFVQASIESFADIAGLATDVLMMFADARDRLEGTKHAVGTGTAEPWGIFAALDANTNVEIISTTAATIGEVDLHSVYRQVPIRWRNRGTWCMNPLYSLAVKRLGTAVSSSYSGDLTQPVSDRILGRPLAESDDAPTTQTTTANDNEIVFGDFSNFVVVDKPGSMSVEFIPHLFNTANNLPDGRRGWFAYWRNGSDSVNDSGFRILQDKTSA